VDEEGEGSGQELEDVQLDGGDAAPPAADPLGLSEGAVESNASQQHSSV